MKIIKYPNAVKVRMENKRVTVGFVPEFNYYKIQFKRLLEPNEPTTPHYKSEKIHKEKVMETAFTVSEEAFLGLSLALNEYIRSNFFTEERNAQVGEITK